MSGSFSWVFFLFPEVAFCLVLRWGLVFVLPAVVGLLVCFFGGGEYYYLLSLAFGFVLGLFCCRVFLLDTERDENSWPERGKRW